MSTSFIVLTRWPITKRLDEDALVERVRTICIDAVQTYPDEREAAIQWALDKWQRDVGSPGSRDDPEVRDVIRRCVDLAYFGKKAD
jgi:hypothetical protein